MADGREDIVSSYGLLTGADAIDTPDGAHRPAVSQVGLEPFRIAIFEADGVEGLLVLTPAG